LLWLLAARRKKLLPLHRLLLRPLPLTLLLRLLPHRLLPLTLLLRLLPHRPLPLTLLLRPLLLAHPHPSNPRIIG
jgi:hypothetical protein